MTTITTGSFQVFTYKAGLLSRLAHDLRLTLQRFEVTLEEDSVRCRFWPESLCVDGAVYRGAVDPSTPGRGDKQKIHDNIPRKILHTARFPEITFDGSVDGRGQVAGTLVMNGRSQRISLDFREESGRYRGATELIPTRWGIAPFKAVGGAIKLQDRVRIEFELG